MKMILNYVVFLKVILILANSADPDEMQHYAAFHLCLQFAKVPVCPFALCEVSIPTESILGHLCYHFTDVHIAPVKLPAWVKITPKICVKVQPFKNSDLSKFKSYNLQYAANYKQFQVEMVNCL